VEGLLNAEMLAAAGVEGHSGGDAALMLNFFDHLLARLAAAKKQHQRRACVLSLFLIYLFLYLLIFNDCR